MVDPTPRPPLWNVEVFYDGACPLCLREVNVLRRLDRKGRIRFTDIAAGDFDAHSVGLDHDALMATIHGRLPGGEIIEGVEVFRRLYSAVGFGWLVAVTRMPGISHALDLLYGWFARNRLRLTGRCEEGRCEVAGGRSRAAGTPKVEVVVS